MPSPTSGNDSWQRRLGPFDATMIVMGGIVGSGIFVTPATVARSVGTTGLIVGAWLIGGVAPAHFRLGLGVQTPVLQGGLARLAQAFDEQR